ncbi:MAG: tetratricopeptide repeat protein [Gammaproteobacteria bacterium]
MLYRLSASRQRAEILERLFPDGPDALPRLEDPLAQGHTLNALALAYQFRGEPQLAVPLFRRCFAIFEREGDRRNAAVLLCNLSESLRRAGKPREAERMARLALSLCRKQQDHLQEAVSLQWIGLTLALCGNERLSETGLRRALAIFSLRRNEQSEGVVTAFLAQRLHWLGEPAAALPVAQHAWELARIDRAELDFIRAAGLYGTAALVLGDLGTAGERLGHTLTRARAVNLFEEELPALAALAELHRRKQEYTDTRDLLDHIWELARRGPYPTFHADALNVLAQIERDQRNHDAAVAAATQAYVLAWCDGPPYAYHYGLTNARKHLAALGAPLPVLPPFDPARFEPLPEVELNPDDEFHV